MFPKLLERSGKLQKFS